MIVDLLRNDLGRVCRPGSVDVPRLFALESASHRAHLVSTVTGQLADGADAFRTLPARRVPRRIRSRRTQIRAMEIIAELERPRAGSTAGAIVTSRRPARWTSTFRSGRSCCRAGARPSTPAPESYGTPSPRPSTMRRLAKARR